MDISVDASKFDPGSLWHPQIEADFAAPTADEPAGKAIDVPSPFQPIGDFGAPSSAQGGAGDALRQLGVSGTVTVDGGVNGKDAEKDKDIGPGPRAEPASRDLSRGVNVREHARAEVNAGAGDIRLQHGQEANLRRADGEVSVSRETTLFAANNSGSAPAADAAPSEGVGPEPAFNVVSVEGSRDVSVASASASGEHGSIEVSALGAQAQGEAAAGFGPGTVRAEASGSAGVYLAKAEAEVNAGPLSASGEVAVGAEVEGATQVEFDPAQGDVNASAEASAFVGVRAEGETKVEVGAAEASAQGDVGAGLGAEVKAEVGLEDGTLTLDVGAHAYLGVGGGGELSLEIDVPELAGDVAEFGQGAWNAGADAVDNAGEFAGHAVSDVAKAWNALTPW
jgi:hypothetical protein